MNHLVRESVEFIVYGTRTRVQYNFPGTPLFADIDEGQLGQAISNIVLNAVQAMPKEGQLEVGLKKAPPKDMQRIKQSKDNNQGNMLIIYIKDEGVGIKPDEKERIFDPFFTSKPHGVGLGLAITKAIIENHSGCIRIDSEPGKGSAFNIYLPL